MRVTAFALGTLGLKTDGPSDNVIVAGQTEVKGHFVLAEESPDNVIISDPPTHSLGRVPGGRTQWI